MKCIGLPRRGFCLFLPVALLALLTGCTSLNISRTVAVKGLPPVADAGNVKVAGKIAEVTQPYQIVGKVTVYRTGTRITESASQERICKFAAQIGADGVIDLHPNFGHGLYSALAVKWLAPGEKPQPKEKPFMVALLPIVTDPRAKGNQSVISKGIEQRLVYLIDKQGYYLLTDSASDFNGGIDGAMKLPDAELQALGGNDADYLMEVALVSTKNNLGMVVIPVGVGLGIATDAVFRTTIMEKSTRRIIFQKEAQGTAGATLLWIDLMAADQKRIDAAYIAAQDALSTLPPIHENPPPVE